MTAVGTANIMNSLVNKISFPGELKIPRKKRDRIITLISKEPCSETLKNNVAAVEIQRVFRGWRTRKNLLDQLQLCVSMDNDRPKSPARLRLEKKHSSYLTRTSTMITSLFPHSVISFTNSTTSHLYKDGLVPITASMTVSRMAMVERMSSPVPDTCISFEEFCVQYIQHWWYKRRAKKNSLYKMASPGSVEPLSRDKAASMIQRSWRRHIDIQVYHYYRDLIKFYSRGNPKLMLKCINPKEAELLDFAAGIHIRFRLAGEKFPPNIYYKIFTYRPVTDVNSFAPRDYTVASWAVPNATIQNNKIKNPNRSEDLSRWYQRQENNGWRLVSDRIFTNSDTDHLIQESSAERKFFHFSRLRRQKDIEAKRVIKKREWMSNMYKRGKESERDLTESEIEELVTWCDDLNFDSYVNNWLELATAVTLPTSDYLHNDKQSESEPL